MKSILKRSISMLLVVILVFTSVMLSGCEELPMDTEPNIPAFLENPTGIHREYYGAKDYDRMALDELASLEIIIDLLTEEIINPRTGEFDDPTPEPEPTADITLPSNVSAKLKSLINEYRSYYETDYIYDMLLRRSDLLSAKYRLAVYLDELRSQGYLREDVVIIIYNTLGYASLSNELACRNGIIALQYAVYDNGISDAEVHLVNAINHYEQAAEHEMNMETIDMMLSCLACYTEVLMGLEIAGITPDESYLDDSIDTDSDGISDGFELAFKINPYKADTDGDGLDDYFESMNLPFIDPTLEDTDGNGIIDLYEDNDFDWISNEQEAILGTSPTNEDSDYDKLDDRFEIDVTGTDPLKMDTDDDGLTDYEEFNMHTNPNAADTDGNGILDIDEFIPQLIRHEIEVEEKQELYGLDIVLSAKGYAQDTTDITDTYNLDVKSSSILGLVGSPIHFNTHSEFIDANISFYFSSYSLGAVNPDNLAILWYDESMDQYKLINSVVNSAWGCISADITETGTYLVVDFAEFSTLLTTDIPSQTNNEIVAGEFEDGDADLLNDYDEEHGMLTLYGWYYSNPEKKDTDDDGLTDGEEMGVCVCFLGSFNGENWYFKGYDVKSDPRIPDTDHDGLQDILDGEPFLSYYSMNIIERQQEKIRLLEIYYEENDIFVAIDNIPEDATWYERHKVFTPFLISHASWVERIVHTAGFKYDRDIDGYITTLYNVQRLAGYNKLIDDVSTFPFFMVIDCEPIYFFDNGHWYLIELWKGQYGLATGCEIGIYEREDLRDITEEPELYSWWRCVDASDFIHMSCSLYNQDTKVFYVDTDNDLTPNVTEKHWWLTGFMPGIYSNQEDLIMDIELTFNDTDMYDSFFNSLIQKGYTNKEGLDDEIYDEKNNIERSNITFKFIDVKTPPDEYSSISNSMPQLVKLSRTLNEKLVDVYNDQKKLYGLTDNSPASVELMLEEVKNKLIDLFNKYAKRISALTEIIPID